MNPMARENIQYARRDLARKFAVADIVNEREVFLVVIRHRLFLRLGADVYHVSWLYCLKNFLNFGHYWPECFDSIVFCDEHDNGYTCITQVLLIRQILIGGKKYIEFT